MSLRAIQGADGFARIGLLDDAVEALVPPEELQRRYLDLANTVRRLYKAILPDPAAREFAQEAACMRPCEIRRTLRRSPPS